MERYNFFSAITLAVLALLPSFVSGSFYLWEITRWTSTASTEQVFIFTQAIPQCDEAMAARGFERLDDVSNREGVRIVGSDVARADVVEFNVYSMGHYTYDKNLGSNLLDVTNATVGHCFYYNAPFNCDNVSGVGVIHCQSNITTGSEQV